MHNSHGAGTPRPPAGSARRSLFLLGATAALLLLLAALFRSQWLEPLVVRVLQRTLGLQATAERVGGSVIAGIEIEGLRAAGPQGTGSVAVFEAERLSVRYSLASLLRGTAAFVDSLELTVAGARLDLDLNAPQAGKPSTGPFRFPTLPRLTVRDSRLRLLGAGFQIEAEGIQGDVAHATSASEQTVELHADRFSVQHPALRQGTVSLSINGRSAPRRLEVSSAKVDGQPIVEGARLDLGERPGDLGVQFALRLWGGSGRIELAREVAGAEVRWDVQGMDLRPDLVLANPALGALRGRLSAQGSARLGDGRLETLAGSLALDWEGARIAGRAVDRLSIEASAEPGVVRVRTARGRIGPNEIRLQDVELPAPPLFAADWRGLLATASGSFSASLGDVPGFFALWGVRAGSADRPIPEHRLRLEGTLDAGTIRLTQGALAAGPSKATLEAATVTLPPDGRGWVETGFSGATAVDIPRLQEVSSLFPVPPIGGSLRGKVSGRGTFARPEGSAMLTGRGISVAGTTIGDVDLRARGADGKIEIERLDVRQNRNRLTVRDASLSPAALAAAGRQGLHDGLTASFELRCADLPALAVLAGMARERLSSLPAEHLLTAAGTVNGREISVPTGSFSAAGSIITLRAVRVTFPPPGGDWRKESTLAGDLAVDIPDLAAVAAIFRLRSLRGSLVGRARLSGTAADPAGSLEASGSGLVFLDQRIGDVTAKISAGRRVVTVEALEVSRGPDRLHASGAYDLERGTVRDVAAELTVADIASWFAEFAPATIKTALTKIPVSGRLRALLRAAGPVPGSPVAIEAEISEGSVQDVRPIRGSVKAQLAVDGPLRRPRIAAATVSVQGDAEGGGRTGRLSLGAEYEPGRLQIRTLAAEGSGGLTLQSEGTIPLDPAVSGLLGPGEFSLRTRVSMPHLEDVSLLLPPPYRLSGSLGADIVATGPGQDPKVRVEVSGERLRLPAGTRLVPPEPFTLAGALVWSRKELRAENVHLQSPAVSCTLAGGWASPPPPLALASRERDALTGSLSLRASFKAADIGWLGGAVEGLRGLRGSLSGEIAADGPAAEPRLSGSVRLADGAFRYRDLPPVDEVRATAAVDARTLTLQELDATVGGSPLTLSGSVGLARPDDPTLDLRLRGTNILLYRAEGFRVRADSELTLRGPVSALSLAGEVALTDSLYQKTFSVVSLFSGGGKEEKSAKRSSSGAAGLSFPSPPLRGMRFDVLLTAREPFKIVTSVARGTARPDLRLTGTGLLPVLHGTVFFEAGQLMLPSGTLEIERGTMLFREGDPSRPELDFGGRMQTRGFEITAQIGGTLDTPEVILSSIPPLPNEELVIFVLTGAPPAGTGELGQAGESVSAMATPLAVYLGKGVFEHLLGAGPGSGGVDLQGQLELQVGRELTKSGSMTMDARLLLKRKLLGRRLSLYLTGEKDVYDQENIGMEVLFRFK